MFIDESIGIGSPGRNMKKQSVEFQIGEKTVESFS